MTVRNAGKAMFARTSRTHTLHGTAGTSQAADSSISIAGAERERRRLSIIFQRPMRGMSAPRFPKIQGRSCQSPRAQR